MSTDEETGEPTTDGAGTAAETQTSDPDERSAVEAFTTEVDSLSEYPLEVENLEKHFGGITAVDGASFDVERGSLTGLIGPNGAGKSTTFNLITGFIKPDAGTVRFDGDDITGESPPEIANRGMVRTFQIARELGEMTVLENMMLAPKYQDGEKLWRSVLPGARNKVRAQEDAVHNRAWEMLEFFEIDHLWDEYAKNLSGGQRKLLEMARVLMTDPQVVLLDEPLAGVNPTLEKKLLDHVHDLREQGYTFLLVEHDMDVIMQHCEHVIVMHQGKVLAEGEPAAIKDNDQVIDAYLGDEI